jgi:thiamine biosynthesis lipoprotein
MKITGRIQLWLLIIMFLIFDLSFSTKSFAQSHLKGFHIAGLAQGTTYRVTYYEKDSIITKKQIDSILVKLDSSLSIYKPYSLISQFNNSPDGIEMDEHLHPVIQKSIEIYKETKGISDITVYPLVNAWGFGPVPDSTLPEPADIQKLLPCVGSDKIHVQGKRLIKDIPCVKIDVNGIAQGYSVDVVAGFLEKNGIQNYLVEIGGEIYIKGHKHPSGELMSIGIESPGLGIYDEPIIQRVIRPGNGAITTSGNYRKYFQEGDKTFSHLISPKTGYPFQNEMITATVWARNAITADGYDNALMGMGLKQALLFMQEHTDMEAYFIYKNADGSVSDTATAGFHKFFR